VEREGLISLVPSDRMRVNGSKVCHERFRLDIRQHFFTRGWSNTGTGFLERWSTSQAQ